MITSLLMDGDSDKNGAATTPARPARAVPRPDHARTQHIGVDTLHGGGGGVGAGGAHKQADLGMAQPQAQSNRHQRAHHQSPPMR
jgi:hypothetical protein